MTQSAPVNYMQRSREYYAAHGYTKPYGWAHFDSIPFSPLKKPLSESNVTIITTSMPDASYVKKQRRSHIGDLHNPPESMFTDDLFWDKQATHTNDINSYFPARQLSDRVAKGELGSLATHYYGVPTNYSHRATITHDAPAVLESCQRDAVDVALLVPL
ncbi:MAG: D-proline reductase (dithiol) PrdB [Gammaproteobacteria bacterium]|jgi:D-proline reductase (dithiol) PrdB